MEENGTVYFKWVSSKPVAARYINKYCVLNVDQSFVLKANTWL